MQQPDGYDRAAEHFRVEGVAVSIASVSEWNFTPRGAEVVPASLSDRASCGPTGRALILFIALPEGENIHRVRRCRFYGWRFTDPRIPGGKTSSVSPCPETDSSSISVLVIATEPETTR
jgi:hypothetical protein